MNENPYEAPATIDPPPVLANENAEAIRKKHIGTEATIKSVGVLYYLGSILFIITGISGLIGVMKKNDDAPGIFIIVLGISQFYLGFKLRQFKQWARILVAILSIFGLFAFPIGTVISIYILIVLLGKKGSMVFSPEYQSIIAETPHVKYKTSKVIWGLLILIIVVILILAGLSAFFYVRQH